MIYTTDTLITSIRNRGQFVTTTNTNNIESPSNILSLASEELWGKVFPLIKECDKEFYVTSLDIAWVANKASYALPTRAGGVGTRSIRFVNGSTDMPCIYIEYDTASTVTASTPIGFYFENNSIVLYPPPLSSGPTTRIRYLMRPSRLEQTTNCATITAINTGTNTVTVSALPTGWAIGTVVDFIRQIVPYPVNAMDQTITGVSGTDITFASLSTDTAIGDYLALAEYSPLPQIPLEFMPLLAQLTVCKMLEAKGDQRALPTAKEDAKVLWEHAQKLITPRDKSHPDKIVPTNWRRYRMVRGFVG